MWATVFTVLLSALLWNAKGSRNPQGSLGSLENPKKHPAPFGFIQAKYKLLVSVGVSVESHPIDSFFGHATADESGHAPCTADESGHPPFTASAT